MDSLQQRLFMFAPLVSKVLALQSRNLAWDLQYLLWFFLLHWLVYHLSGRSGITNKSGSVFCSVSTLTSGDSLDVSLRNAATKLGSKLQESGKCIPQKAVWKLTLRNGFFSKYLFAYRSFLDLEAYMCLKGARIWHRLWACCDTEAWKFHW